MLFIKRLISPIYFGLGASKFCQNQFEAAIPLFEKVLEVEKEDCGKEQLFSSLGQCYYHVGRLNDSLRLLKKAYDMYKDKDITSVSEHRRREFMNMLDIFHKVLTHFGEIEYANLIRSRIEVFKSSNDSPGGSGVTDE